MNSFAKSAFAKFNHWFYNDSTSSDDDGYRTDYFTPPTSPSRDDGYETDYFTPFTSPIFNFSAYDKILDFFINHYDIIPVLKNIKFNQNSHDKVYAINGDVQSGKTKTLASFAITSLTQKQKSVIIVRNFKDDCSQIVKQLNNMHKELKNFIKGSVVCFNYSTYTINDIDLWLMDDQCDILVLMANTTQLKQFVDKMKDVQFSLFVDEADALMNTIKTKKDYNVNHCMKLIYEQSKIVFLISATNYAILFEHSISTSHIFYINKHKNYKGINDIEFNILQDSDKNLHGTLFEKSPNLPYVVTNLTHRAVYDNHPIVLLIKFTHLVSDQDEFIRTIFTYDDWKHEWAAISYNGTGINMYHHTFNGDINIKNTKGVDLGNCIYSFKNIDIQDTLTYLRENGGQSRFPRIVIISGHLASRCINFMDTTYNWHITDEYIDPSKTMNCTDLIQSLRICGIHNMSTPLNVWTTESVIKNIVYTNINIGEFIHQYVNSVQKKENEDVCCKKMLTRVKIHKDKLGDKPVSKVRAPYTTVSNEKHDNMDEILGVEKNTSDSEPDSDIIKEGLKKVKIAYETKNGLVHKIIKAFVNNDFEGMTQTKLESHCCVKISNIKHYMEWASHGRYKIIYKKNVNGQDIYNLDSEIVKHLNLIK